MKNSTKRTIAVVASSIGIGTVAASANMLANRIIARVAGEVKMPKLLKGIGYVALSSATAYGVYKVATEAVDKVIDVVEDLLPDEDKDDVEETDDEDWDFDLDNAPMMEAVREDLDGITEEAEIENRWGFLHPEEETTAEEAEG